MCEVLSLCCLSSEPVVEGDPISRMSYDCLYVECRNDYPDLTLVPEADPVV